MKMRLFFPVALALLPVLAYNQTDPVPNDPDQLITGKPDSSAAEYIWPQINKRLETHLEAGTAFNFSPGNFYGPSYYISPCLTYRFTPRFLLSTGVGIEYSRLYSLYGQNSADDKMLPMTRAYLYARGSYFVTPRFIVSGTVYENMMNAPRPRDNNRPLKYNQQGMSVGFQYKFSKSFSFGFEMHMQNGYYHPDGLIPAAGYVPVQGF
jgi:hypothetical protein